MNLKNISNLLLLIVFFLLIISCSKIDLINKKNNDFEIVDTNTIEILDYIDDTDFNNKTDFIDFYNRNNIFKWKESTKLKKIYKISFGKKSDIISANSSNIIISNDFAYYVDSGTIFIKLDIQDKNIVFETKLLEEINPQLTLPTSLIKHNDFFYVGFGNGIIIKIDQNGKYQWKKTFNDLLRTPLRMVNDNIILLFNSNKIVSLNSLNGEEIWKFNYELNKPPLSDGGQVLIRHNLIFFVMPNGRIGAIDSIVGEAVDYSFLTKLEQRNILNYNYEIKLHVYDSLLSLFEDGNTVYTYDLNNKEFLLYNEKIFSLKSIFFVNNILLGLKDNNILNSFNLKNKNIFWNIDLSKFLSKNDKIIESYIFDNKIMIFFSSGKILLINKLDGEILFKQDLNLSDVIFITVKDNYFILNQSDEKAYIYIQ